MKVYGEITGLAEKVIKLQKRFPKGVTSAQVGKVFSQEGRLAIDRLRNTGRFVVTVVGEKKRVGLHRVKLYLVSRVVRTSLEYEKELQNVA